MSSGGQYYGPGDPGSRIRSDDGRGSSKMTAWHDDLARTLTT
jgi:hypothetical protein